MRVFFPSVWLTSLLSTESVMTPKWQLLVTRSGISKNRLSVYPSQERSVAVCWVLDRRAGFCTKHPTAQAAGPGPARWLLGWVCRTSCFDRRLGVFWGSTAWFLAVQLPDWKHWVVFVINSDLHQPGDLWAAPPWGTGLCLSQFHCSL